MPDLTNSLQESLTLLRVLTVVVASAIGLVFMAVDLMSAIPALILGIDPVDPPTAATILVISIFTCLTSAVECIIQGSIMPIVIGLLINFALIGIGSYLANIAQNLGWLAGLIAILLVPLITFSVHATLLNSFFNQCGTRCYRAINAYPALSEFINWVNRFSLI